MKASTGEVYTVYNQYLKRYTACQVVYICLLYTSGIPTGEPLAPVLERFRKATQREPLYRCIFHEDEPWETRHGRICFGKSHWSHAHGQCPRRRIGRLSGGGTGRGGI